MLDGIEVLCHSSIKISKKNILYVDPFRVDDKYNDADIILITHSHYDHFSEEDINKVKKQDTVIVIPEELLKKVIEIGFNKENIYTVKPNVKIELKGIKIETIPAYNYNKQFHPKQNGWVGYILEIDNVKYYIAGDTDITEENKNIKCDIAFVPVGGTYTMDCNEAANLINCIKPKVAIPIHYGKIIGTKQDAINFVSLVDSQIKCLLLIK